QLRAEMEEDGAETDGRSVHEDELARWRRGPQLAKALVNTESLLAAILPGADAIGDRTHAVVEARRVDEARPDPEHIDQVGGEIAKAPVFIGGSRPVPIIRFEGAIELDHARNECRRKDADAAIIEKIDAEILAHRIIAEMRVSMNDAIAAERHPPG